MIFLDFSVLFTEMNAKFKHWVNGFVGVMFITLYEQMFMVDGDQNVPNWEMLHYEAVLMSRISLFRILFVCFV
jgi:hypothetical protein